MERDTLLNEKIAEFVRVADEISAEWFKLNNFSFPPPTHRGDFISDKWVRVVTIDHYDNGTSRDSSVYGFIALADNVTKALGAVAVGDIHKAATWKAPAKTARGNIFGQNFRSCLTPHGPVYLK